MRNPEYRKINFTLTPGPFPKLPLPCSSTDQPIGVAGSALQDARVLRYHFRTQERGSERRGGEAAASDGLITTNRTTYLAWAVSEVMSSPCLSRLFIFFSFYRYRVVAIYGVCIHVDPRQKTKTHLEPTPAIL